MDRCLTRVDLHGHPDDFRRDYVIGAAVGILCVGFATGVIVACWRLFGF